MDDVQKKGAEPKSLQTPAAGKDICGIVMPISAIDDCSVEHWSDVREIIMQAIESAGFEGRMVNDADDVGVIHKRIIQNLYEDPIVVCDVSGKNSNVMFELGIRLAFDKPTIIIKDEKTGYSFDTSSIEHIEYPRDLRYSKINEFKDKLSHKIKSTHTASKDGESYTTFLKHFGEFKVAKIEKKLVSSDEYIMDELRNIRLDLRRITRDYERKSYTPPTRIPALSENDFCLKSFSADKVIRIVTDLKNKFGTDRVESIELKPGHFHVILNSPTDKEQYEARRLLSRFKAMNGDDPTDEVL